ncbi:hypothetical protein BJ322DRAFT_1070828 [Thelephora terrestris]|uniref:DUF6535 domain-containing protein n=1 Tax=Thelephora terrestris TaxID=56493 RepID=A0A9P6L4Y7_9AGAM|nr:hypothetical protein BJ322DRAFT_1070828 [Thelephora terrestris]
MSYSEEIRMELEGGSNEGEDHVRTVGSTTGGWGSSDVGNVSGNGEPTQGPTRETEDGGSGGQPATRKTTDAPPAPKDLRTLFYEHYHKEAEEFDKEFMQKYGEDLSTTLIFAGLFSAVQPQLQSDPNEETAALLRVLIHKIDNTTFGGEAPALPQWAGPPQSIVHVQCLLYASLFASLLAAFIAMLGKQWLSRYGSIDLRGSAIERSQDRQRKLNGINAWCLSHVLESLPLMLQAALLLMGCALSRYLWEVDTTVAAVVVGMTSCGVLFYLSVVIAGAASINCPYQTPASSLIRRSLRSAHDRFVRGSFCYSWFTGREGSNYVFIGCLRNIHFPFIPFALAADIWNFVLLPLKILVNFVLLTFPWLLGVTPVPHQALEKWVTELDFHCALWVLRRSSDIAIKELAVNFLRKILPHPGLDFPTKHAILVDCFDTFSSCFIGGDNDETPIANGLEELAATSAMCFLLTWSSVATTEPMFYVIEDIHTRHDVLFPLHPVEQQGNQYPIVVSAAHGLFGRGRFLTKIDWRSYNPPINELVSFSRALSNVSQIACNGWWNERPVCIWTTHFAFHFLSQEVPPPPSVVVDCLTLIAIALKCSVPDADWMVSDERLQLELCTLIVQKYEGFTSPTPHLHKMEALATIAFLPYAFKNGAVPISLKYAALGAFEYHHWTLKGLSDVGVAMRLWIAAASGLPDTDAVRESMVNALLQIAYDDELRPHIPPAAWEWLKKRPVLPAGSFALQVSPPKGFFRTIRKFQDIELITSYLFVFWSEWDGEPYCVCEEVRRLIKEELKGTHAAGCRTDLIQRLDHVIPKLDGRLLVGCGSEYAEYKTELLELGKGASNVLTGSHSTFMCALPLPCP